MKGCGVAMWQCDWVGFKKRGGRTYRRMPDLALSWHVYSKLQAISLGRFQVVGENFRLSGWRVCESVFCEWRDWVMCELVAVKFPGWLGGLCVILLGFEVCGLVGGYV